MSKTQLPTVWAMRDGREINIRDMSNTHLANTIAMLRRNGRIAVAEWRNAQPSPPTGLNGEYAQEAADAEFNAQFDAWLATPRSAHIDAMQAELNYRFLHGIVLYDEDTSE